MTTSHVKGLEQVNKYLTAFPARFQRNALRAGLTAAARIIRDDARLRAPTKTGQLTKAIVSGNPKPESDGSVTIRVYVDETKPHGFLGWFHEYGVAPHFIRAGDTSVSLRTINRNAKGADAKEYGDGVLKIGENYISGGVMHPGHAAHPFMRPALDAKANEAIAAFADRIEEYIFDATGFEIGKAA